MRTTHRVIAAAALGLPILFAGSGLALASEGGKHHHKEKEEQSISQSATQSNSVGAVSGDKNDFDQSNSSTQSATNR
jgi:hypothetical protein